MQKSVNIYFLLSITVLLAACGQGNRDRSKIPPSPFQVESVMNTAAVDALTDAIRSNPSVAENYFKRASVFLKIGNTERALEDINRADQLKQNTGKYLFIKALILRKMKKYNEAFSFAQSAEILNVDTPELYTLLGDLSQQKNDNASAEKYLAKSLQIAPYDGETHFYRGTLAARKGDTLKAISLINKAIELKPSFREGYSKLTEVLQNYRMYDSALVVNKSALIQFPDNTDLLVERGLVFFKSGRLDSALVNYEKAAIIDSKRTDVLLYSAAIYYRWKNYTKALENYEKVLDINEDTPKVNYLIGLTQEQLGNIDEAENALKEAVEKNPNDEQAIIALNRVSGRVNAGLGNYSPPVNVRKPVAAAPKPVVVEEPKKLLDTSRLRINTIKPKAKVNVKTDSTKRIGF
ncbi:lipopolysaccharide assembly protein LapB [Emticicia sp. BO119]|uniref:tetratricopeptide repeat protein n=1 Tax=Emticicia sp. BO119 TaxID=2757768 RepID=UPI0015F04EBA|nr:tetratricopeptide repeat protein [Emticicia sp. BO119]MBA4853508.1 tetratricopeptide repeat protein [Emticicia sp. BO119]